MFDVLHLSDTVALLLSLALLFVYHAVMRVQERRRPGFGIRPFLTDGRHAWVERMMSEQHGILAVQSLRNQMMAASFFASSAVLLIIGTLTLTAKGGELTGTWSLLNGFGPVDERVFQAKLLLLLFDLLVGFGAFAQTIRLLSHASYLISIPPEAASVLRVSLICRQAGVWQMVGMRTYYFGFPLLFWLFGPVLFVAASAGLVAFLYWLHRAPQIA